MVLCFSIIGAGLYIICAFPGIFPDFVVNGLRTVMVKHIGVANSDGATSYKILPDKFYTKEYDIELRLRAKEVWRKERGLSEEQFQDIEEIAGMLEISIDEAWGAICHYAR